MEPKTLLQSFPWIQSSVMLDKEIFDMEKVTIALRAKFKSIVCTYTGCKHSSDGIRKVSPKNMVIHIHLHHFYVILGLIRF